MKSIYTYILGLFSLFLFAGCFTQSLFSDFTISTKVSILAEPLDVVSVIDADLDIVYATFLAHASSEVLPLDISWYYLDSDALIHSDSIVLEDLDDDKRVVFSLSQPDGGWPVGTYEIRVSVKDVLHMKNRFIVL